MEWRVKNRKSSSCFLLCILLATVSDIQTISELQNIEFGRRFPRHGLVLLHWLATNIRIDQNGAIHAQRLDPTRGDYGFRHYLNAEQVLPSLPREGDVDYYTLGNRRGENAGQLPEYVIADQTMMHLQQADEDRTDANTDRIVVRVRRGDGNRPGWMDEVYITQHFEWYYPLQSSKYDPQRTYRISVHLLAHISQVNNLYELLHRAKYHFDSIPSSPSKPVIYHMDQCRRTCQTGQQRNGHPGQRLQAVETLEAGPLGGRDEATIKITSTGKGYAQIFWSDLPQEVLGVQVALYKDESLLQSTSVVQTSGTIDTKVPLNSGLQVRLQKPTWLICGIQQELWRGPGFHDANRETPVDIRGYDASLQLYTKDGYACARLYIKKTFIDCTTAFDSSWVGFYSSDSSNNYLTYGWQWVKKFTGKKRSNPDYIPDYNVYEYESWAAIGPGVQARFLLDRRGAEERARTEPWQGANPRHGQPSRINVI